MTSNQPYLCPDDRHLRVVETGSWRSSLEAGLTFEQLLSCFDENFGNYVKKNWNTPRFLRELFHERLPDAFKHPKIDDLGDEQLWNIVKHAVHQSAEARNATRLSATIPPDNIHRMQKGDPHWVGDIYSAEMVVQSLAASGIQISDTEQILDFGCSSGSLLRVLAAAYPETSFAGVDPVQSSIGWAEENLKAISFRVSNEMPQLEFNDGTFDGITAISIWSHFSDVAALSWFDEMYRIVRPGGWLLFTTHGLNTLHWQVTRKHKNVNRVRHIFDGLLCSDFVFEETIPRSDPSQDLLEINWGNSYFRADWFLKNLTPKWDFRHYKPGRNQNNQDLYIVSPKK